jgi:hypothetical protein
MEGVRSMNDSFRNLGSMRQGSGCVNRPFWCSERPSSCLTVCRIPTWPFDSEVKAARQPRHTETHLRKLKILEHMSLDGVIQQSADDDEFPYSGWTTPY